MAEHSILKLDPESHLLLERPLLRLPHELLKKTLKSAQRAIEPVNKQTTTAIQASTSQSPAQTLASLDATLQKAQNLKRKLEALHAEEKELHAQQKARIEHLQTLHEIPSLGDVAYDRWSHVRLDRLLVDYLLRQDLTQSAKELAAENDLGRLVDIGVFEEAGKIRMALLGGEVKEALNWCAENKNALKKIGVRYICGNRIGRSTDVRLTERARTGTTITAIHRTDSLRGHRKTHGSHRTCPKAPGRGSKFQVWTSSWRPDGVSSRHLR
jgi:macrophage erythroblast attacher